MNSSYFEACAAAALDLLAAWSEAQGSEVLQKLDAVVALGARPGVIVTTGDDVPEISVVLTNPHDGAVTVLGRLLALDRGQMQ